MWLRPLRGTEAAMVLQWRNENRSAFLHDEVISEQEHLVWMRKHLDDPDDLTFVIWAGDQPVGTIGVCFAAGRRELARVMLGDRSFARQGVMSEAISLLMRLYGSQRWWLRVREDNPSAIAFYEATGWRRGETHDGCLVMER